MSYDVLAETRMQSGVILLLIVAYGIVVFAGVIGNASLVITLCSASSIRLRNPLLLALCIADLFVSGISAPLTVVGMVMNEAVSTIPAIVCRIIQYVQAMPVAASTISFLMLSMDRYATVKHPRLAQLRQRRYLHTSLALFSWTAAALVCMPLWYAYPSPDELSLNETNGSHHSINQKCEVDFKSSGGLISFVAIHTTIVFLLPGFGVFLNHFGVRNKLCALSLTARAAHGELPLPMPILRRPTHVIIVTGITNAQQGCNNDDSSAEDIQLNILNKPGCSGHNIVKTNNPISPRAMREIRAQQQRQKISYNQSAQLPATPGIPLPQTSTLRSRRRLANMLIASSLIFIGCWIPHVFCVLYTNLTHKQYCSKTLFYFNLLLGYFHSAVSPIIYWALNHNTLRQSPCAPIIRLRSVQSFLRSRFRAPAAPPPASSTNEAALGPFNPKLIKTTPKQYRNQASSHYLY